MIFVRFLTKISSDWCFSNQNNTHALKKRKIRNNVIICDSACLLSFSSCFVLQFFQLFISLRGFCMYISCLYYYNIESNDEIIQLTQIQRRKTWTTQMTQCIRLNIESNPKMNWNHSKNWCEYRHLLTQDEKWFNRTVILENVKICKIFDSQLCGTYTQVWYII